MAAGHIPEEPAGPDRARLPGRGLHLLCAEGTSQSSGGCRGCLSKCLLLLNSLFDLFAIFDSSLVIKVHCQVIYNSEDEFLKYDLFGFVFSFFTYIQGQLS